VRFQTSMSEPDNPTQAVEFAYKTTVEGLKRSTDVDSCVALASRVDERIEAIISRVDNPGEPIACQAGCSFCCHLRVMVRPHEAIALFRYLRSRISDEEANAIVAKVLVNADLIGSMSETEHMSARIPCAFLVDNRCNAYSSRPAICAAHHSLDRKACEDSFNDPTDAFDRIPMRGSIRHMHGAMEAGISKALESLNLNGESVELHTAVAALLRDPSLIARWRKGRSLLKTRTNVP
jgi:Fe-S-cluster containining protein